MLQDDDTPHSSSVTVNQLDLPTLDGPLARRRPDDPSRRRRVLGIALGAVFALLRAILFLPGGINHVILCTDGDFNLGITSDEQLVSLIQSKRASGVTLRIRADRLPILPGVREAIEFKTADALQRPVPCERGVLMFNPPYGALFERLTKFLIR